MTAASLACAPGLRLSPGPLAAPTLRFGVHAVGDPRRAEVEQMIRSVYRERYQARVPQFAPVLVSLSEGEGLHERVVAAAGYRVASSPLFLERYLDRPVEQLIGVDGAYPERSRIVEVGHLAAIQSGQGRRLILQLAQHLAGLQVEWVVSTLTEELRQLFNRMGVTPLALGAADPARLGTAAADWGSYYDHRPVVLAGHLPLAMRRLALERGGLAR